MIKFPQCVLFDLDGTLLDSIPGIAYSIKAAFDAAGAGKTGDDLLTMLFQSAAQAMS